MIDEEIEKFREEIKIMKSYIDNHQKCFQIHHAKLEQIIGALEKLGIDTEDIRRDCCEFI